MIFVGMYDIGIEYKLKVVLHCGKMKQKPGQNVFWITLV